MKATLIVLLFAIAFSFLAGCKAPDEMTGSKGKDATDKVAKQAGGDD